jgi:predicted TIM-barrel enzyme
MATFQKRSQGGSTGYAGSASLHEMAVRSQFHFELAKEIRTDVILLAHGAALVNPEDAQYLLDNTDCQGVQLGSSIERLAIEGPLKDRASSFKTIQFRRTADR